MLRGSIRNTGGVLVNEYDVSLKVAHAFERLGYDANKQQDGIKCPKCGELIVPKSGRPDRAILHPSARSCYVEVKVVHPGEKSFPFARITVEQRATLDGWRDRGGVGYLALGIIRRPKRNDRLESLFLIEWGRWCALEGLVRQYQDSIPVLTGRRFRRELQDQVLDITHQLWQWALKPVKGGWEIPARHPAITQLRLGE
jgi:hypothetical protein